MQLSSHLLVVSAHNKPALMSRLADIQEHIKGKRNKVQDIAYTLGTRRDHLSHRAYLVCDSENNVSYIQSNAPVITVPPSLVFIFTGQGAQWAGMGRQLMDTFATFHDDIRAMDWILKDIESPPVWSIEGTVLTPFDEQIF